MPRLSNEEFVQELTKLYTTAASSSSGSVYLTSKRITHPDGLKDAQGDSTMSDSPSSSQGAHPVIFRATDGHSDKSKKVSISTAVQAADMAHFQTQLLGPAIRAQMAGFLRKRDKAKERKEDKALLARRKKDEERGGWKGVAKLGSKRGAGHRQRQRAQKRAMRLRQEERNDAKKQKANVGTKTGEASASTAAAAAAAHQGQASIAGAPAASAPTQQPQPTQGGGGGGGKKKKKGKK